jgi:hypothetical protein
MTIISPTAAVLIGDAGLLHQARPPTSDDVVTLVRLPDATQPPPGSNTMLISWETLGTVELVTRTVDGTRRRTYRCHGRDLFDNLRPGPALRAAVTTIAGNDRLALRHTPLFCAVPTTAGLHTYSRVRPHPTDACFIRTNPIPLPNASADEVAWLNTAIQLHAAHADKLNSHECCYQKCFPDLELEYKYTLPADAPIWTLAAEAHHRINHGDLTGMIAQYRDDLQVWDYLNHLFEVTGPDPQRGYVSFLGTGTGTYRLKRKQFTVDAFARQETVTPDIRPDRPLDAYVRDVTPSGPSTTVIPTHPLRRQPGIPCQRTHFASSGTESGLARM